LVVTETGGELIEVPVLKPTLNRVGRSVKVELSASGSLSGQVQERCSGTQAAARRRALLAAAPVDRAKLVEKMLSGSLNSFRLQGAQVANLEQPENILVLQYQLSAERYAQAARGMLLLRPRIVGNAAASLPANRVRRYPIEMESTSSENEVVEIMLPEGYEIEELPAAVDVKTSFGAYRSKTEIAGRILKYTRYYEMRRVVLGPEEMLGAAAVLQDRWGRCESSRYLEAEGTVEHGATVLNGTFTEAEPGAFDIARSSLPKGLAAASCASRLC